MRYISKLLASTGLAQVEALKRNPNATKPKGRFMLFTTADGKVAALTRDAVDKGLPQAAGINIIDGDKIDDGADEATAALALAEPAGEA